MSVTTTQQTYAAALTELRNADPTIVPHVIGGKEYFDGALIEREDPCDPRRIVSGCHEAPAELVQLAVDTSRAAQREWARVPVAERAARVRRAIDHAIEHRDEFALRLSLELGKSYAAAVGEVEETLQFLRIYPDMVEQPHAFEDEVLQPAALPAQSLLRPYGVFAIITPFNYPIPLAAGPAIAAVLAGNGAVIKSDQHAPWAVQAAYELFAAMDLPTGLVNIVHGGDAAGKALVAADVDGISFVGSAEAGASIMRQVAAGPYMRPVIAEMGGKNPVIVTDTADLELAADGIIFSSFDVAGQKCSGLSRVLVTPGVRARLTELVVERAAAVKYADPTHPDAYAGPLVNKEAVDRYVKVVADARAAGFTVAGGERLDDHGYFVQPTVVRDVPEDHWLARTEHFVPLVTISEVASFEEALAAANDSDLGLSAGIYTGSREEARRFLDEMEAGCINVNAKGHAVTGWWPGDQTFGGWKGSGSTGKQAYGKWYVQQFAREQARKISVEFKDLLD
ncbi:aldehyde dehydrogenase family protein [Mycobacterium sp. ITM-2016-00317]|uniref:aldehyde dehydrogenase family protein n=1 Tax=Mycobacterium sp. ITM-2016-00317 TaxID=2099694 RepID=UPI000D43E650|nr:aldehyde dehydrogenase family protein [Mycobacterium sp. ITM-2016-00317]WNG87541.1 aldehyde dehydrogenase family protein [Mycobacterium sp. ITM-2016-00317]